MLNGNRCCNVVVDCICRSLGAVEQKCRPWGASQDQVDLFKPQRLDASICMFDVFSTVVSSLHPYKDMCV